MWNVEYVILTKFHVSLGWRATLLLSKQFRCVLWCAVSYCMQSNNIKFFWCLLTLRMKP